MLSLLPPLVLQAERQICSSRAALPSVWAVPSLHPSNHLPVEMSAPASDAASPGAPGAPEGEGGPPGAAPNLTSNRRLQQTQAQVDEVVDIMRVNVDKVLERDQKLSELDDRADALQAGASQFESSAAKLKNKYWWKNCKMMIMMGVIGVILMGIVFMYFYY
ncbi:vesicle-associated membrane protein 2-like [Astyanax mexicanus]|uniref:Vesicle-associated membrane protein 2-like n=3 Tax=Astyanax mexicanus TaxID=7994 RepID=A0A8T2M503_ASTMX|nr:vesicle-associated membrane protein 2-like [Astyanax mexicanus]